MDTVRKAKYKHLPVCGVYDGTHPDQVITDILCYTSKYLPQYYITDSICTCYWICDEVIYSVKTSVAIWPEGDTLFDFVDTYIIPENADPETRQGFVNYIHSIGGEIKTTKLNHSQKRQSQIDRIRTFPFPLHGDTHNIHNQYSQENHSSVHRVPKQAIQSWVKNNVMRINLYFRDMVVSEETQEPAFKAINMFSNIGGIFGLWGGVSLLTILEMFVLFVRLFLWFCCRETGPWS